MLKLVPALQHVALVVYLKFTMQQRDTQQSSLTIVKMLEIESAPNPSCFVHALAIRRAHSSMLR